jgi:hypothetical protein
MRTSHGKALLLAVAADTGDVEHSNREAHGEEAEELLLRAEVPSED